MTIFNEQAALDAFIRAIRRWKRIGTRGLAGRVLGGATRTATRRVLPILALSDPHISRLLIGWMADLGAQELKRRKLTPPTTLEKVNDVVRDIALRLPEGVFALIAAGVDLFDSMTDAVLPDGPLQDIVDVPEEVLRDAAKTVSELARALRTGERR